MAATPNPSQGPAGEVIRLLERQLAQQRQQNILLEHKVRELEIRMPEIIRDAILQAAECTVSQTVEQTMAAVLHDHLEEITEGLRQATPSQGLLTPRRLVFLALVSSCAAVLAAAVSMMISLSVILR